MAQENGIDHYINKEQSSDRKLLKEAPTASEIVNLTLVTLLSISLALISVFAWTSDLISTAQVSVFVFITAAIAVICVGQVSYEARQLRRDLEDQMQRKYTYWMPDHAKLPANHPKSSK